MTAAEKIARKRDGRHCRRCGIAITGFGSLHHRLPRGMGGSKSPTGKARADRASNLVLLCGSGTTGCHGWVERHRRQAYETGWLVHRDDDPQKTILTDIWGRRFQLTDQGHLLALIEES